MNQKETVKINNQIEEMINKPFENKEKGIRPCWAFCRKIARLLGHNLGESPKELKQQPRSKMWNIVLFDFKYDWHAGIVWPDGLHFIHFEEESKKICQNRLTEFPWKIYIEGYYTW